MLTFVLNDEWHAEHFGEFGTKAEALVELQRLAMLPWDEAQNLAPCSNWPTCGRRYELVEYDNEVMPWRELGREPALEVSHAGVSWLLQPPNDR